MSLEPSRSLRQQQATQEVPELSARTPAPYTADIGLRYVQAWDLVDNAQTHHSSSITVYYHTAKALELCTRGLPAMGAVTASQRRHPFAAAQRAFVELSGSTLNARGSLRSLPYPYGEPLGLRMQSGAPLDCGRLTVAGQDNTITAMIVFLHPPCNNETGGSGLIANCGRGGCSLRRLGRIANTLVTMGKWRCWSCL